MKAVTIAKTAIVLRINKTDMGVDDLEKLKVLYDHYKETVKLSLDAQTKRNRLFVFLCLFEILNFVMLLFPQQITEGVVAYFQTQYKIAIDFSISVSVLQGFIWLAITYTLVRYFQTMIYVERQYKYIAVLEKEVSERLECSCFDRESHFYLEKYPKALDLIHIFYTWIIPVLFILVNLLKFSLELAICTQILPLLFSFLCCLFCILLSVLVLSFLHLKKHAKERG